VQDGIGRYQLQEMIGRNDKGETWRAFDNVTQRVVAVTVLTNDRGDPVTILADDGGDTVAKEIPQWAAGSAPALDYPGTGSGYVYEYPAYSPIGSTPAGLPPNEQTQQDDPVPAAPKKSRKRRLIVLSSLGVIVVVAAVVAGVVLIGPSQHSGTPQASSTSASTAAPANTGPFTGTFAVKVTAATLAAGDPATDVDAKAYTDTWTLRSACSANGCVATASAGNFEVSDMVFDQVGGSWFAVAISHIDCDRPHDEAWNVVSLTPQPDGTMSGEVTRATATGCFTRRTATLTRTGDTDITTLPDPTHLDPRTVSPAEALHGKYDAQMTFASGYKSSAVNYGVRTDCLRAGDRCMSFFISGKGSNRAYVFANGTWTRNENFDLECSLGGTHHVTYTETMALPQPPQDPIASLIAHGYDKADPAPGVQCQSQTFDDTYTRTGD
jgi:serine/threonine-protein kinase